MLPLAYLLKPKKLEDFYGQEHIVGKDKILTRLIESDRLKSIILYGPPGVGKTSLANIIANTTKTKFYEYNAVNTNKKDIENVINEVHNSGNKATLFLDEIHRFNKLQQDYLLPYVENGDLILIGATTENPYYEVNKALISRSIVLELKPLSEKDILNILENALKDEVNGLGKYNVDISESTLNFIARNSCNDARTALNVLELAVLTTKKDIKLNKIILTNDIIENCMQKKSFKYDKEGTLHYDIISAFIKSMRGSDPNATTYYLACMLEMGEDINFIARRILICASEDVGNADPRALEIATSALIAVKTIGMPESRIILSQAANYIALAPKSNSSYLAINKALDFVRKNGIEEVPSYLKQNGINYNYPHIEKNHINNQHYLPKKIETQKFFEFSDINYEKTLLQYHKNIQNKNI